MAATILKEILIKSRLVVSLASRFIQHLFFLRLFIPWFFLVGTANLNLLNHIPTVLFEAKVKKTGLEINHISKGVQNHIQTTNHNFCSFSTISRFYVWCWIHQHWSFDLGCNWHWLSTNWLVRVSPAISFLARVQQSSKGSSLWYQLIQQIHWCSN